MKLQWNRAGRWTAASVALVVSAYLGAALLEHRNDVCFGALTDEQFAERVGLTEPQAEAFEELGGSIEGFCAYDTQRLALLPHMIDAESENAEGAWKDFILQNADNSGVVDPANYRKALSQRKDVLQRGRAAASGAAKTWEALGPVNQPGRIQALAVDPFNPDHLLLGAAEAGLWVSFDEGRSWESSGALPSLPINTLVFSRRTPGLAYALLTPGLTIGASRLPTNVIYKSVDGGFTWEALPNTGTNPNPVLNFTGANGLAMNPDDDQVLIVTNNCSIVRSSNGGQTWASTHSECNRPVAGQLRMLPAYPRFDPQDGSHVVAGTKGGIVVSRDGGQQWTRVPIADVSADSYVNPAFAASAPGVLYAVSWVPTNSFATEGQLFKSTDGGFSWQKINTFPFAYGDYTNQVWVDPGNPNTVVTGGIYLFRSTDGGATLTRISGTMVDSATNGLLKPSAVTSPHADVHAIVGTSNYDTVSNRKVFIASDVGVMMAPDITAATFNTGWKVRSGNLGTAQYYGIAASSDGALVLAGSQDNGIHAYRGGTSWATPLSYTDFGRVQIDQSDSSIAYTTLPYLDVMRSKDGGINWTGITDTLADRGAGNFSPQLILDPSDPRRLYAGGRALWVTADARSDSVKWRAIKPAAASGSPVSSVAISSADSNIIWVGHNNGEVYFTTNGQSETPSWTRVTTVTATRPVGSILIDAKDSSHVYVGYQGNASQNMIVTSDAGAAWTALGGLPEASVVKVVQDPAAPQTLYVGTSVGVYESIDGGASWSTSAEGPGDSPVADLAVASETGDLIVATFSRGAFVLHNALTPRPKPREPVVVGAVFSSAQTSARSVLRVYNSGVRAGAATLTLSDATNGQLVARWTTPSVPPGGSQQYFMPQPEGAAGPGLAAKSQYYTVSVQADFPGHLQHVVWRPDSGTLSNLSTCNAGASATGLRLTHVHSSRVGNTGYPSSIVIHNTSDAREVELIIADAVTGKFLGRYSSSQIPAYGEKIVTVADIEAAAGIIPAPDQPHYTISIASQSSGYIQHLVENKRAGATTDLSAVCPFSPVAQPVEALKLLRLGAVNSPRQGSGQSFLRVTNNGSAGAPVLYGLYDPATGRQVGISGSGDSIPPGGSEQISMADIERLMTKLPDANGRTSYALPNIYSLTVIAPFAGTFQHVLYQNGGSTLTNLSTCNTGVTINPRQVTHVHSTRIALPSYVVVHNTGTAQQRTSLTVADVRNGNVLGTVPTALIPPGGEVTISSATIEDALNIKPDQFQLYYNISAPAAFTGYLQHLVDNEAVGVTSDMTTACRLN